MKKTKDEMRAEYDFNKMAGAVRGKHVGMTIRIIGARQTADSSETVKAAKQNGTLPCPFCGAKKVATSNEALNGAGGFRLTCRVCGACGPWQSSKSEAKQAWNQRDLD